MPVFKVNIDRKVVNWDRFTRFIEADNEAQAEEIGNKLADEANNNCPDDAGPGNFDNELEDWDVNDVEEAEEEDLASATDLERQLLDAEDGE
jgi:hypothetical protein